MEWREGTDYTDVGKVGSKDYSSYSSSYSSNTKDKLSQKSSRIPAHNKVKGGLRILKPLVQYRC